MNLSKKSLILFFTQGVGLTMWNHVGNLDREIEIYKKLANNLEQVDFVTYGGQNDLNYKNKISPIKILPINQRSSVWKTVLIIILKHRKEILNANIFKTNQILGSDVPILLKKIFKKKLIVRCGYLYSYNFEKENSNKNTIKKVNKMEKNAFLEADLCVVTTKKIKRTIITKHNISENKITVIPNYINTNIFKPNDNIQKKYDLIFVGRHSKEKNLQNLIEALKILQKQKVNVKLLMIGGCINDKNLKNLIQKYNLNIKFTGNVPNYELPKYLNASKVFILPSLYEGHPKALLEAMSCELPCIGSNVDGIKDEIKNKETGYICETNSEDIAHKIKEALSNTNASQITGQNARKHIINNYSVEKILKMELNAINKVLNHE